MAFSTALTGAKTSQSLLTDGRQAMVRKEKLYRVYEVLADTDSDGPAGDGTVVFRFRQKELAHRFALSRTCYGRPASVQVSDVPRRLAERYGVI